MAWTLHVRRDQNAFVPNGVPIRVDYKGGAAGQGGVGSATLTINDRSSKAVSDLVDLKLDGAGIVEGGRPTVVYAVVANKSSIPFQLTLFAIPSMWS